MKNNPITITMKIISKIMGYDGETKRVTYDTMSQKLGVARQTVINYEKDPDTIPCSVLKKLSLLSGLTIDELADDADYMVPFSIADIYSKLCSPFDDIVTAVNGIREFIVSSSEYDNELGEVITRITEKIGKERKLNIAVCGMASTGKSSLINDILGEKVIPVNRYYGTPAFTYYHHISEKPDRIYGKNDTSIVCVPVPNANVDGKKEKEVIGYYSTLLKSCVKNDAGYTIEDGYIIKSIDVYLDNEILKGCTITDTPSLEIETVIDYEEIILKMIEQDCVLFTTNPKYMLKSALESDFIWRLAKLERVGYFICPNIVITHMDLYNDSENLAEDANELCKENLLSAVPENEKKFMEENYENRFYAVDFYNKERNKAFSNSLSAKINELAENKFCIIMNYMAEACSLISKDYYARKVILSSGMPIHVPDESKLRNAIEGFVDGGREECKIRKEEALENFLKEVDEIVGVERILNFIKEEKITRSTYLENLDRLETRLIIELNKTLEEIVDSGLDKFYNWVDFETKKLDNVLESVCGINSGDNVNNLDPILYGCIARYNLNSSVENPYDAEQMKSMDKIITAFDDVVCDEDEEHYGSILRSFDDLDKIPNRKWNEHLAKTISSQLEEIKGIFVYDFDAMWKSKTKVYFDIMEEMMEKLREYLLPEKRWVQKDVERLAEYYGEASKKIEKIGQMCRDKIENVK